VARLLVTLGLLSALLAPASASARAGPQGTPASVKSPMATSAAAGGPRNNAERNPVTIAANLAKRYWHAVPCGGRVTVRAIQPLPPGLEATTDGWVTFQSSLGPDDLEAPAASYTNCTISLARWQWPDRLEMASDWNMFCLTMIHEMGHLLGHAHSLAPGSVMAPVFIDESDVPPICSGQRLRVSRLVGLT
jgi:Matrixin